MEEDKEIGKEIGLVNAVAFDPKSSRMVIGERTENFRFTHWTMASS